MRRRKGAGPVNLPDGGGAVVVTGAGRGIGRALTELLVDSGRPVLALDVDAEFVSRVADDLGDDVLALTCDVGVESDIEEAARQARERFERLDGLVNNAGVSAGFDPATMTTDEWDKFFSIDLRACWLTTKHFLPALTASAPSSIVNVASIHSLVTVPHMFPYAAAKSAVVGLSRALALDLAPRNIRVNVVSPGWTRTRLVQDWFDLQDDPVAAERSVLDVHPMGRIAEPEEIAEAIAFLLSLASSAITGAELRADVGLSTRMAT